MEYVFIIGRIIFGAYWLSNAYTHLFKSGHMIGYAQSKGVPAPKLAIMGSGVLLALGGLSVLFGLLIKIGLIALAVFLVGVTFKMHDYWKQQDPMAKMSERIQFQKNMALLGAVMMLWALSIAWPTLWTVAL